MKFQTVLRVREAEMRDYIKNFLIEKYEKNVGSYIANKLSITVGILSLLEHYNMHVDWQM